MHCRIVYHLRTALLPPAAGYEYEPASQKCIQCKAGTARAADYAGGCVAW